uniref:Zinc finger protein 271 n=1 Tax=Cacopsylla melanoneura TaxID=428564 RepID=A0A8D8S669_9HEMI
MSTRAARRSPRVKEVKEELEEVEEEVNEEMMMVVEEEQEEVEEVDNDEGGDADDSDADGDYVPPPDIRPGKVAKEEMDDEIEDMPIDIYEFPNEEESVGEKTIPGHLCKGCYRIFTSQGGLKRHLRACPNIADKLPLDKLDLLEQSTEMMDDTTAAEEFEREGMCHCCGEDIETAHVGGEFPCSDCEKSFKLRSSYERHRRVIHSEGTTFDCPECNARCPDKGTLARHMYTHTGLKPYECPVCHKEFSRRYHLVRHNYQTGCNGKQRPTFPCQVCGRIFNRKDNLREHLRAHAGETKRKKKYKCDQCVKEFYGITLLKIHQRLHTEGGDADLDVEPMVKMEPGKRGRPSVGSWKSMKALVMQGEKPYECDICHNRFPSSGAMKKHRRKHTGERPYECKEYMLLTYDSKGDEKQICTYIKCYAKFAAKETLNRHMKTHSGVKPHACEHCGKAFIQASQLKAHMFHHTGENGHTCDICNKTFNRKARLELHIKYIHEGADPFQCDICRRTFIRKEDLNRHSLLHTGVKPHKCPICTKGFTMKSSLKIHLLTHTKEPPRACEVCGRAFIRQDCLLRHLRQKHRDHMEEVVAQSDKKKLEAQLLAAAACELTSVLEDENEAEGSDEEDEEGTRGSPPVLSESELVESMHELLSLLIDEESLKSYGWPEASVDSVIEAVISQCGHTPATETDEMSYADSLRENAKLLFSVVTDDAAIKQLLNNQTVDQVILHMLRLAKS